MSEKTVFQKIIDRELPSSVVFENEEVIIIKSIQPKAPIHLLGISKKPFKEMHELLQSEDNKELLWEIFSQLATIAKELGLDKTGYKLTTNIGKDGGQSIPHLHIHLLGGTSLGE